jgi:branched-chain amino acid transport system substrate-binding protein
MILAEDDLRKSGPTAIEIYFDDSAADPKTGLSALERLHRVEGCSVFVSSVSGVTLALLPVVRREGLLLFANAAHPDVTGGKGFVFRYANTVDSEARTIAEFFPTISARRVYCIAINDDYGKSYVSALERLSQVGGAAFQIVGTDFYDRTATDFRTLLAKARGENPDAFVLIGFGRALGLLVRQLREAGDRRPFVASLGFVVTPEALESAGEAMRGGYFLTYSALQETSAQDLRRRYRARFGEDPSPSIILDYAIPSILSEAYKAAGYEPAQLAEYIGRQRLLKTPFGTLSTSGDGNIIAPVRVTEVPRTGPIDLWGGQ